MVSPQSVSAYIPAQEEVSIGGWNNSEKSQHYQFFVFRKNCLINTKRRNKSDLQVATALAEVVRNARNERGEVMDIAQYYYMYALEGKYISTFYEPRTWCKVT